MSEQAKPTIYEIFAAAKKAVGPVGKDSRNTTQNFNFRGIDAVVNAAAPHFDEHGVITVPVLKEIEYTTVEVGQKRTPMAHVRVKVTYQFFGPKGDHIDADVPGEAMDSGDKATAKAMSVAYRIALIQALNLPTGDPDPDSQTYERSPRQDGHRHGEANPFDQPAGENGTKDQPRRDQAGRRSEPGQQPAPQATQETVTDQEWLDRILPLAGHFKTADEGAALWHRVEEKRAKGECSDADARKIGRLMNARKADLAKAAQAPPLPPDDAWATAIKDAASADDLATLDDDFEQQCRKGTIPPGARAVAIRAALDARKAELGQKAGAAV